LRCGWFAGLGKLHQSIKLSAKHCFYGSRDLLKSAIRNPSTNYAAFAVSISSVYLPNRALLLHHAR
jgi:hypothetical protein